MALREGDPVNTRFLEKWVHILVFLLYINDNSLNIAYFLLKLGC